MTDHPTQDSQPDPEIVKLMSEQVQARAIIEHGIGAEFVADSQAGDEQIHDQFDVALSIYKILAENPTDRDHAEEKLLKAGKIVAAYAERRATEARIDERQIAIAQLDDVYQACVRAGALTKDGLNGYHCAIEDARKDREDRISALTKEIQSS